MLTTLNKRELQIHWTNIMNFLKLIFTSRNLLFLLWVVVVGCLSASFFQCELNAQEDSNSTSDKVSKSGMSSKLQAAIERGEIEIKLSPMVPSKKAAGIGWSPKGNTVRLSESDEGLSGKLLIGKFRPVKMMFQVDDAASNGGTGSLKIDLNGDAKFDDGEMYQIKASKSRGKFWYSFKTTIPLAAGEDQVATEPRPYAISLWHVIDPREPANEQAIRWSRDGWHEGQIKLGDQTCTVVISDSDSDGLFSKMDAWGIGKTPKDAYSYKNSIYKIGKHAWFDSVAYEVTSIDKDGGSLKMRAIDVGMTQAEEQAKADPFAKDRKFPRSGKPFVFLHDYEKAIAQAKQENKQIVIDFVTTWCGPCKSMDQHVYTAKPIFDKSQEVIFLKLDGDDERDLNKQFKVEGYPTLILLDSEGKELGRRVGYQGVADLLGLINGKQ